MIYQTRRKLISFFNAFRFFFFLELGISLEMGVYVSRIYPGSVAAKEGNIAVGDRVLNVGYILSRPVS